MKPGHEDEAAISIELQLRDLSRYKKLQQMVEKSYSLGSRDLLDFYIAGTAFDALSIMSSNDTIFVVRHLKDDARIYGDKGDKKRIILPLDIYTTEHFPGAIELEKIVEESFLPEQDPVMETIRLSKEACELLKAAKPIYQELKFSAERKKQEEASYEEIFIYGLKVLDGLCLLSGLDFTVKEIIHSKSWTKNTKGYSFKAELFLDRIKEDIGWVGRAMHFMRAYIGKNAKDNINWKENEEESEFK
ncbi:hypothetical protein HYX16_04130 [Candidatus Woesearchaeota archaeon]|nr:hypothetical protein [Candidatus Woesearchaeota archaeon]